MVVRNQTGVIRNQFVTSLVDEALVCTNHFCRSHNLKKKTVAYKNIRVGRKVKIRVAREIGNKHVAEDVLNFHVHYNFDEKQDTYRIRPN